MLNAMDENRRAHGPVETPSGKGAGDENFATWCRNRVHRLYRIDRAPVPQQAHGLWSPGVPYVDNRDARWLAEEQGRSAVGGYRACLLEGGYIGTLIDP